MQSVVWNSFGLHTEKTKTLIHFFPSAGALTAPYPAQCRLTAFGSPFGLKTITLDGGRVSQPDGVCVEDVFSAIESEKSALYGLTIELVTMQPRLDIAPSLCVVEFITDGFSSRYHPTPVPGTFAGQSGRPEEGQVQISGIALKDKYTVTSLVVVNAGESEVHLPLSIFSKKDDLVVEKSGTETIGVAPASAKEFFFSDSHFKDAFTAELGFGTQLSVPLAVELEKSQNVALYFMYRDASSGCPLSVCRL